MKYFFDTEFIEAWKKPIKWLPTIGNFNKPYHSIQLISIGIVAEDGKEYYAISNEFNPNDASEWVKENVISKLPEKNVSFYDSPRLRYEVLLYKSNKEIVQEIKDFIQPDYYSYNTKLSEKEKIEAEIHLIENGAKWVDKKYLKDICFYAYYADYDWVLLCSLFGTMMDLPTGFPMYCVDLKQNLDSIKMETSSNISMWGKNITQHPNYPKQENEHNALYDAKWNKKLYEFLNKI